MPYKKVSPVQALKHLKYTLSAFRTANPCGTFVPRLLSALHIIFMFFTDCAGQRVVRPCMHQPTLQAPAGPAACVQGLLWYGGCILGPECWEKPAGGSLLSLRAVTQSCPCLGVGCRCVQVSPFLILTCWLDFLAWPRISRLIWCFLDSWLNLVSLTRPAPLLFLHCAYCWGLCLPCCHSVPGFSCAPLQLPHCSAPSIDLSLPAKHVYLES